MVILRIYTTYILFSIEDLEIEKKNSIISEEWIQILHLNQITFEGDSTINFPINLKRGKALK